MKVNLAYGKSGLDVDLPDNFHVDVITPQYVNSNKNPLEAIRHALNDPIGCGALSKQIKPEDKGRITPLKG